MGMEWKEYYLQDICETLSSGGDASKFESVSAPNKEFCIPIYANAIENDGLYGYTNRYVIEKDAVTIAARGAGTGHVSYRKGPFVPIVRLISIVPKDEIAITKYLYYYFKTINFRGDGSAIPQLTIPQIKKEKFILPSLQDQKRIADILSSLDAKIENNNKINAKLEEMAQALFKSWFIDFEPFKVGRDGSRPAFGSGNFVESELGMIPEGWKVGLFTEIMDLKPGGTPKTDIEEYWINGTIPFFSPKDVTNHIYTFSTEKYITEKGLYNCSSQLYPKDTVFITARGTVGKVAMSACDMAMNQSNYALVAKEGYTQKYLYFVTKTLVDILLKKANGAVFSAITGKDFKERIVIPDKSVIANFTEKVEPIFDKIYSNTKENINLAQTRDTLLPKLMSGEIEL